MVWHFISPDLTTCDNSLSDTVKEKISVLRRITVEDLTANRQHGRFTENMGVILQFVRGMEGSIQITSE